MLSMLRFNYICILKYFICFIYSYVLYIYIYMYICMYNYTYTYIK